MAKLVVDFPQNVTEFLSVTLSDWSEFPKRGISGNGSIFAGKAKWIQEGKYTSIFMKRKQQKVVKGLIIIVFRW